MTSARMDRNSGRGCATLAAMRWLIASSVAWSSTAYAESKSCAIHKLAEKAPTLTPAKDLPAARKLLLKGSVAMEHELDIIPDPNARAFSADVRRAYEHGGDSSYWDSSAVFVLENGRVVIAKALTKFAIVIPEECAPPLQEKILDVRVEKQRGKRELGLVRIRRATTEAAVLSVAPTKTGECAKTVAYRIEDHVIDLGKRREILVVGFPYTGPVYEEHDPPLAVPQLTAAGALAPAQSGCSELKLGP